MPILDICCGADGCPVVRPQCAARGVHSLGIYVFVAAAAAIVSPGDDSTTRAIGDNVRILLVIGRGADGRAVVRPQSVARGVHSLGIYVEIAAATIVRPCNDSTTGAIGDKLGLIRLVGCGADGRPVVCPQSAARGIQPLGIYVEVVAAAFAIVEPDNDRTARAVGDNLRILL